jgi:Spy/CpxP family protein refolding chaperone
MKRPLAVIVFAFILGMATGAFAHRLTMRFWRHGPPAPEKIVAMMARDLTLDDSQRAQILAIVREQEPKIRSFHQETQERFDVLRKETDGRISAVLRPDQRVRFEARLAQLKNMPLPMMPDGPPPPP